MFISTWYWGSSLGCTGGSGAGKTSENDVFAKFQRGFHGLRDICTKWCRGSRNVKYLFTVPVALKHSKFNIVHFDDAYKLG